MRIILSHVLIAANVVVQGMRHELEQEDGAGWSKISKSTVHMLYYE